MNSSYCRTFLFPFLAIALALAVIPAHADNKLGGVIIGTSGSWNNSGNTKEKAMDGNLSTFFDGPDPGTGEWVGLDFSAGNSLDPLTNTALNPNWPSNPAPGYTKIYANLETETNTGLNNYGQRLRAFVVPPTNGAYTFWIASDDSSQLRLSSDENS